MNISTQSQVTGKKMAAESPLASDLIWGADLIAAELGLEARQVYHQLSQGKLPARKLFGRWCASRSGLRRYLSDILLTPDAA